MRKSIYGIILDNTEDGIVDEIAVCKIIDPAIDGKIKMSAGFLDTLVNDDEVKEEHTEKILKVIGKIFNNELSTDEVETELIRIDFKTLNVMDSLIPRLNIDNYNVKVYKIFKELVYKTKDIEICKFALEMTGITNLCEEMVDDYVLFGQVENFSNSISFIMRVWQENEKFVEGMFKLLEYSESWGAINYTKSLMQIESVMESIENQKRILIGALNKNPLTMESCTDLGYELNIVKIIDDANNDRELSMKINILFESLLLEADPCGGIMVMEKPQEYLKKYIGFLKETKYFDIKFFGFRNLNLFLIGNEKQWIRSNKQTMINEGYEDIVNLIEMEWSDIDTIENFEEVITWGNDYMYSYISYALENKISREVMIYFEDMYRNEEMNEHHKNYLEKLLVKKGSDKIRKKLYFMLSDITRKRIKEKHEYSKVNIFKNDEESRKMVNKIFAISYNLKLGSIELLKKLINDYDPMIRSKALECVEKVYESDESYIDDNIKNLVKEKTKDEPPYVASKAKEVCEKLKS
ncbi:MAG: hypothetical protein ACRDCW_17695 [Sarcina sp.]